jgi:hypothetical protein
MDMLIFTNRFFDTSKSDEHALQDKFEGFSDVLRSCQVKSSDGNWQVTEFSDPVSDKNAIKQISAILSGDKSVLVFLHGNNTSPADCFIRCKAIEDQYDVAVIGYSWESKGFFPGETSSVEAKKDEQESKVEEDNEDELAVVKSKESLKQGSIKQKADRYKQAKVNAENSRDSLARFLRLVAASRLGTMRQKVSFAAYSLGCHFLRKTIAEQDAEASLGVMHNVILLSGCTSAANHQDWVGQIHPLLRVYIIFTKADSVLAAARVIDGDVQLGADPGRARVSGKKFRYIDFEGASKMKIGAHRYFVADPGKELSKQAKLLFIRLFKSEEDFVDKGDVADAKEVYPVGCSADGSVCYMGASSTGTGSA